MTDPRDAFLDRFHARHPGITARVLERARVGGRGSSYEILAALVNADDRVLALGCGDGPLLALLRRRGHPAARLVGIDASAAELRLARERPELTDVDLRRERAEALTVASASVDCVLSHLAFTVFSRPAAGLTEIARVLRPGGVFATVVGGGPVEPVPGSSAAAAGPDAFALFPALARADLRGAENPAPRLGDARTHLGSRLRTLLNDSWSPDVTDERVELDCDGSFDQVWALVASSYEATALAPARLEELRALVRERAARNPDGTFRCRLALRLLTARRCTQP